MHKKLQPRKSESPNIGNPRHLEPADFENFARFREAVKKSVTFAAARPVCGVSARHRGEQICRHAPRTRVTMARRGADPPRFVDETEDERATRLAAEDVHLRIERARHREVEDAYWRTREMALGVASVDHRRAPTSSSTHPRATPGATPRWIAADAHADAHADAQIDELARSTGVSRRIADEVLAAERSAILAAVGPPASASASARVFGTTPRAPPTFTPRAAALPRASFPSPASARHHLDAAPSERSDDAFAFCDDAGVAAPRHHPDSPAMTTALWQMAHTPPPTAARRAMGYRALGETNAADAARAARDALERAAEDARAANRLADDDDEADGDARATADAERHAAAEARRRIKALSDAAATAVEDALRSRRARSPGASSGRNPTTDAEEASAEAEAEASLADAFESTRDDVASPLFFADAVIPPGTETKEKEKTPSRAETRPRRSPGRSRSASLPASPAPVGFPWTAEDAEAVRAARAAVRRAERAEAAVLEEERRARAATKAAVATLLDARVRLAAATARSVAEEAAAAAVFAAAEVASLKLAMEGGEGKGDEEGGGKENVDDPFSEALAGYAKIPLPVVPKA